MKRKMRVSMLTTSLLLALMSLAATAQAAPPQRFSADLGVLTPAGGQTLRVTVAGGVGNNSIRVRFRWMQYGAQSCSGTPAVCRHMVVSEGATAVTMLDPNEALSLDFPGTGAGFE